MSGRALSLRARRGAGRGHARGGGWRGRARSVCVCARARSAAWRAVAGAVPARAPATPGSLLRRIRSVRSRPFLSAHCVTRPSVETEIRFSSPPAPPSFSTQLNCHTGSLCLPEIGCDSETDLPSTERTSYTPTWRGGVRQADRTRTGRRGTRAREGRPNGGRGDAAAMRCGWRRAVARDRARPFRSRGQWRGGGAATSRRRATLRRTACATAGAGGAASAAPTARRAPASARQIRIGRTLLQARQSRRGSTRARPRCARASARSQTAIAPQATRARPTSRWRQPRRPLPFRPFRPPAAFAPTRATRRRRPAHRWPCLRRPRHARFCR